MTLLKRSYVALIFGFLYIPILVLILFSFNASKSRGVWEGFTFKWYEGWSSYCAGKAGLDRFTEAVQLEESRKINGVKLVSIAPGIIDTNMQGKIREASESEFALVNKFKDYKSTGQLSSAEEVASKLIEFVEGDQFYRSQVLTDLRQL